MKVPKPKRGKPAEEQVKAIISLLQLWPEAPGVAIEQFIKDKFKVVMTEACLQEAKRIIGLHEPDYTEKTAMKKAFAQVFVARLVQMFGVSGISEKEYISKVTKALSDRFDERTNGVLLKSWVMDVLTAFASTPLASYHNLLGKFVDEFKKLDTMDKRSRQESLYDPEASTNIVS